ncbi:MAG TPA: protein-export chaperone SecB [Rhodocyclaceae bacterium]|jgi:preprotein translocase subunit SecB
MSEQQPVFSIEKLYVKDLSLEVPNAPFVFMEQEAPNIEVQIQNNGSAIGDGMYEVSLTVTVTAKNGDKAYFLVEVSQAGIFRIEGVPEESIEPIMAIACPNILFPYARETVSDAVNRAGFPPVILAPVNFEAIYQQRQAEQAGAGDIPIQ